MIRSDNRLSIEGVWEVKRHISVPAMSRERDALVVGNRLAQIKGMRGVCGDARRQRLTIVYDVTQLDYDQVLDTLKETGFPSEDGPWERFKARWFQYLDTNGRENANAPEAPCCSSPKGLMQTKR